MTTEQLEKLGPLVDELVLIHVKIQLTEQRGHPAPVQLVNLKQTTLDYITELYCEMGLLKPIMP